MPQAKFHTCVFVSEKEGAIPGRIEEILSSNLRGMIKLLYKPSRPRHGTNAFRQAESRFINPEA